MLPPPIERSSSEPTVRGAPRPIRAIGRAVVWLAKSAVWFVFLSGVVYYFFGETVITATLDGKPVASQVFVNDKYVGDTPQKLRLSFDATTIVIIQPDGTDTNESEYSAKSESGFYNIGSKIEADFTSIDPNDQ